jgi:NADH-quinone oxidoreductase subunit H
MVDFLHFLLSRWLSDWLIVLIAYIIVTTIILIVTPVTFMMQTWFERRMVARMQDRLGPNRVGPFGLLQAVADGVKMFTKEDITPRAADRWVHLLAPVIAVAPVMLIFAVLPWGRGLVPADTGVSILFVVAVSSVAAVGLMMAGWGSNNKFALLGAMRAVAQMVSYEIPAVLGLLGVVLLTGTMSLAALSDLQSGIPFMGDTLKGVPDLGLGWFVFTPIGLVGFVIFFISVLSEGERTPFDIPEADSEIVAGYMTEYSGMKFAIFYMGQFLLNYALSTVAALAFLGGWQGPGVGLLAGMGDPNAAFDIYIFLAGALSVFYLVTKAWVLFFVMIWLRGTFPRLRVDQLMGFAWKFLLPLALVNILSVGLWVTVMRWGSTELWTFKLVPFGFDLLGWLETAPPWLRQLVALVITGVINGVTFYQLLLLNRRPRDETPAELAQNQVFGTIGLP